MGLIQKIITLLQQKGYQRLGTEENLLWVKDFGKEYGLVMMIPEKLPGQPDISWKDAHEFLTRQENGLMIKTGKPVYGLLLIMSRDFPSSRMIEETSDMENVWIVDRRDRRLMIFEHQLSDFYSLRQELEELLVAWDQTETKEKEPEWKSFVTPINTIMILINVAVFFVLSFMGSTTDAAFMADHGAMSWSGIMVDGEFWRMITSGFLHFGADHLFHNMLALVVIGSRLENLEGHAAYLLVYMGSLLASAATSLFVTLANAPYTISARASGAVFGVIGALLCVALAEILDEGRKKGGPGRSSYGGKIGRIGFLAMLAFALVGGVAAPEIDNAAHAGGLAAGFIIMAVLILIDKIRKRAMAE